MATKRFFPIHFMKRVAIRIYGSRPESPCAITRTRLPRAEMDLTRRSLIIFGSMLASGFAVLPISRSRFLTAGIQSLRHSVARDEGDRIGPPPKLPPLPSRPYPHQVSYLFTDGSIWKVAGFVQGLAIFWLAGAGYARAIPYGFDIRTDEQKLWLLGRTKFVPKYPKDVNHLLEQNQRNPFRPVWAELKQSGDRVARSIG